MLHYFTPNNNVKILQVAAVIKDAVTWEKPVCGGPSPGKRSGHTLSLCGSAAYLFGGCPSDAMEPSPTNELFKLEISSPKDFHWQKVRQKHMDALSLSCFGVYMFPTTTTAWTTEKDEESLVILFLFDTKSCVLPLLLFEVSAQGSQAPQGRSQHTASCYNDNIIVF